MRRQPHIHPIGCSCASCAAAASKQGRRTTIAAKRTTRALFIIATLCAIPFVIAWAFASAAGDRR